MASNAELMLATGRVRVQEEQLLVRGQRPQVGRHDLLGGVADGSDVDHGLQSQHAAQLRGLVRVLR
eukprot:CAMPEP_0172550512 /NCGR_PEP_ID=MMETSP1067-20121228/30018_1 /TAXON_ID=265564 ORGANISM="Thalassiosira punctigera, Strain Tpunct2005C2" /NCGR_SAMPLE_ID=MMETSP1067 /ASSEMBLY_ACC=CAM_ASM_000444 /LENGTH=65 /DNA_ID=CAMNT_0013338113 /DNA_START=21 /DNA_END=214 /DNA_ORIENTATION=-